MKDSHLCPNFDSILLKSSYKIHLSVQLLGQISLIQTLRYTTKIASNLDKKLLKIPIHKMNTTTVFHNNKKKNTAHIFHALNKQNGPNKNALPSA